jgi:alpha-2-macroglobulin
VVDKDEYEIGDTAEVLIPSPYQGEVKALVTVERGRIIEHSVLELTSNSQVLRLPVEDAFAPNVYVSVVIVKGIDESSPAPSFKMGLAQLKVSTEQKRLTVIVTPRVAPANAGLNSTRDITKTLIVAPREKVVWDVETTDASGKGVSADVSLALVDKAVLTLANDPAGKHSRPLLLPARPRRADRRHARAEHRPARRAAR